jgi:hypothetical protein
VGINEIEENVKNIPRRIIEEIIKSDCLFAIASPRDVSILPHLIRTLSWLQNEVSFGYMADKPILIMSDVKVSLSGLIADQSIPVIKYDIYQFDSFLQQLNGILPFFRKYIIKKTDESLQQSIKKLIDDKAIEAFKMGMIWQRRLLLEE